MCIYMFALDSNRPYARNKRLYRHVDVLNAHGIDACIVHSRKDFRCTWFENSTRVINISEALEQIGQEAVDHAVIPETVGVKAPKYLKGIRKVVFNQCAYNTFLSYSLKKDDFTTLYHDDEVIATLVVSEDNKNYLEFIFPEHRFHRITSGIDSSLYCCGSQKQKQIAFAEKSNMEHIRQVITILKFRGILKDYRLAPIKHKSEKQCAQILGESQIFLNFSHPEGFGLTAAEAMLCGCIVVGYDGFGGREYMNPGFSYPVEQGDVGDFARVAEEVISLYDRQPAVMEEKARMASAFIRENYSLEKETKDIMDFWTDILTK